MKSKNFTYLAIAFFSLLFFISCKNDTLTEDIAISSVEEYLRAHPIYDTAELSLGEVKFRENKDLEKIQAYKELASKGYINLELLKEKKKFLSKDSIYVYKVSLTSKSSSWILRQKKNRADVKSFEYLLDSKEKVKIELDGKKSGKVIFNLQKSPTDFSVLVKDKHPHTSFITKTFKLRYKQEKGWVVTREK